MSILLDTGVLYAFVNMDDPRHEIAKETITQVGKGSWGRPIVTDYVIDELLTLVRMRRLGRRAEQHISDILPIKGESALRLELLDVTTGLIDQVADTYQRYADQGLSFTDASHLTMMKTYGIDYLATFDLGFEGLAAIVPPNPDGT